MKHFLKHCAAQILVIIFYVTGIAYRTGNNQISMVKKLKNWAEK